MRSLEAIAGCRSLRDYARIVFPPSPNLLKGPPRMSEVQSGLEGVVAFATEIAEPDKEGGALRYRGVDIEDLVGKVPFEQVWGLLVDGTFEPGLPPAEPHPLAVRSGDPRVDVQSALAMLGASGVGSASSR